MKKQGKKRPGEGGFSLVETMIATLLISVVVTSVFSLALTSKVSSIRVDRRSVAIQAITQAREKLKAYVTADKGATITGPNTGWRLPEDDCGPTAEYAVGTCSSNCSALDICAHNVTRLLPVRERSAPIKMRLIYTVTKANKADGEGHKVIFNSSWEE